MAKKAKSAKSDDKTNASEPEPNADAEGDIAGIGKMDPVLLARLKGEMGDTETIGKIFAEFAGAFTEFLPEVFQNDVPFSFEVRFDNIQTGYLDELITNLGDKYALCDASLRGWCSDYALACGNTFVMVMVEALLGASDDGIEEPEARALSKIELELAKIVFERISGVMRSIISLGGNVEPILSAPYNASSRPSRPEGYKDHHAAILNMKFKIGDVEPAFAIIIPQYTLLKTKITSMKSNGAVRGKKGWTDQLKDQVERSEVGIQARIKLQDLTLDTISRLQVGDVIPFQDGSDVRVEVNANGKDLYVGEFGRSGSKYTVRVLDTYGTEEELLSQLIG